MIEINGKNYDFVQGETVLELLRRNGIYIAAECGGRVKCGKCRVVCEGEFSPLSDAEKALLSADEIADGIRLACCCRGVGNGKVHTSRTDDVVEIPFCGERDGGEYAIACDIGTTTLATALCKNGTVIDTVVCENPQRAYAADVVGRIEYIGTDEKRLKELQKTLIDKLNDTVARLCANADIDCHTVKNAVFAGNTVMQYIFCGICPEALGRAPYRTDNLFGINVENPGLIISKNAEIYLAPCVSAYIGGDITAGLALCDFETNGSRTAKLFVDIGTNAEIALYRDGKYYFCSAAAGPALEGAHIKCGSIAVSGAINAVQFENGKFVCETVDGAPPQSLCGSGIIDVTAALVESGICTESGAFADDEESVEIAENVEFTQSDVRQVQLAKAAVAAGILTLCEKCGVGENDLESVTVAGTFGSNINIRSAQKIGLIPFKSPNLHFEIVGNSSLAGAVKMTASRNFRMKAEQLSHDGEYVELASNPAFNEHYTEQMFFDCV